MSQDNDPAYIVESIRQALRKIDQQDKKSLVERTVTSDASGYPSIEKLVKWLEQNKIIAKGTDTGKSQYDEVDLNNGVVSVTSVYGSLDKSDMKKLLSHSAFIGVDTEIVDYDFAALVYTFKFSAL